MVRFRIIPDRTFRLLTFDKENAMKKKTFAHFYDEARRERWRRLVQELNPDIDPGSIRLMEQMRLVSHALYQIGEHSLSQSGLSYAQYRILLNLFYAEMLDGRTQLNPSEISDVQGTSRNTISGLIRNLEEEGLVERHLDEKDRRKFNICLSQKGRDLVKEHNSRHMNVIGRCFSALDAGEQETLETLLTKVGESAREGMKLCK